MYKTMSLAISVVSIDTDHQLVNEVQTKSTTYVHIRQYDYG